MALTNWNTDKIIIGIETIDTDHDRLLELMEAIKVATIDRESSVNISQLCTQLVSLSRNHFDDEERLLLKYFYPDTEAHIGQHMTYMNIVATLINNLKEEQYSYAIETLQYLANWFVHHISDSDQRYAQFINNKIA